jgi:hypothetical protein
MYSAFPNRARTLEVGLQIVPSPGEEPLDQHGNDDTLDDDTNHTLKCGQPLLH